MKMKKLLCLMLMGAIMLGLLGGCGDSGQQTPDDGQTAPDDGQTQPEEPQASPKLSSLTVDGGYTVAFDPETTEYTVSIPAGRPRVPHIAASGEEGAEVTLYQATIADGETEGLAKAVVTVENGRSEYTVKFVKDDSQGFQLQYADNYAYTPGYTLAAGESFRFESSDPSVVSVSDAGVLNARQVSDSPVTVTAYAGGNAVEELVVDKVIRAPLNMFLIIGQSNAYGWHDVPPEYNDYYAYANTQKALSDAPPAGQVWCDDVSNGYDEYFFTGMYDLSAGRSGFSPALGKEWYALTGEKSFMLQTAIGSTPIETWVKDPSLKFFGLDCYAITVERFNYYKDLFTASDSDFELNRIYAFWLQGESCQEYVYSSDTFTWAFKNAIPNYSYVGDWLPVTAPGQLMTSKQYADYFMSMFHSFQEDVGLERINILPVRAMYSVSSRENREQQQLVDLVPARAAQFALNYEDNGAVSFVTLKTEIGRTESYPDRSAEGWGYMGCNNIHYNQLGYNVIGKDSADNLYAMLSASADHSAKSLEVLDKNGRTHLSDGDEIVLSVGETYQITGYVLPLYAADTTLTFTVEDPSVCTIDEFGLISAPTLASAAGQTTTVTVTNGELTKTISVRIAR
ncbi:MAG: Ig-like domain-containing protein [Oscillospiraceae bacterium]|nr:Ig-like domain-containing protein [Oscillospiraceae bacterium]